MAPILSAAARSSRPVPGVPRPSAAPACAIRLARAAPARRASARCRGSAVPFRDNDAPGEQRKGAAATAPKPAAQRPAQPDRRPSPTPPERPPHTAKKTRVVVLGSGWGAVSVVKNIDPKAVSEDGPYELVLVSPRNYMLFTPLLPSAMGGVVSESSIVESIRNIMRGKCGTIAVGVSESSIVEPTRSIMRGKGIYYEARAVDVDVDRRQLTCVKQFCEVCARRKAHGGLFGRDAGHTDADHTFSVKYDILINAVGAVNATFGVPGVEDHCWFLKTMEDAQRLRRHVSKVLEHAALPDTSPEERRRLLAFLVVGGGPTGVEVAAELHDLVSDHFITRTLPQIKDDVSITLVDGLDSLLNTFHQEVQTYAGEVFQKSGIDVRLRTKVTRVREGRLEYEEQGGAKGSIPFGTCVWATGVAMHPLVAKLKGKLPQDAQVSNRGLVVDDRLRVLGSKGTIFCIGDAAVASAPQRGAPLPPTAQVARQEGEYIAALLSRHRLAPRTASEAAAAGGGGEIISLPKQAGPFRYLHLGSLAYLGEERGVMDLPIKTPFLKTLRGYLGAQAWRLLETFMQVSPRTRWLVANDWLRSLLFGRNVSDI